MHFPRNNYAQHCAHNKDDVKQTTDYKNWIWVMSVQSCSSWLNEYGIVANEILKTATWPHFYTPLYFDTGHVVFVYFMLSAYVLCRSHNWFFYRVHDYSISCLNVKHLFLFFSPGQTLYSLMCSGVYWCLSSVWRIVNRTVRFAGLHKNEQKPKVGTAC